MNVKFIHFASQWQFAGNREAYGASIVLVRSACVVLLLEFYYHFESHKNPSTVLLLIRFVWKQVECDDKFRERKNKEKHILNAARTNREIILKNDTNSRDIFELKVLLIEILFREYKPLQYISRFCSWVL